MHQETSICWYGEIGIKRDSASVVTKNDLRIGGNNNRSKKAVDV